MDVSHSRGTAVYSTLELRLERGGEVRWVLVPESSPVEVKLRKRPSTIAHRQSADITFQEGDQTNWFLGSLRNAQRAVIILDIWISAG